jgi:uncharacterized protein (TIGR00251 family)
MKSAVKLRVRVIPNAKKTEFTGFREDELVLRLNAPAVEGKANKAATEYISRYFGVARSAVSMVSGEKSRHKIFQIVGLETSDLEGRLSEFRLSSIDSP